MASSFFFGEELLTESVGVMYTGLDLFFLRFILLRCSWAILCFSSLIFDLPEPCSDSDLSVLF